MRFTRSRFVLGSARFQRVPGILPNGYQCHSRTKTGGSSQDATKCRQDAGGPLFLGAVIE